MAVAYTIRVWWSVRYLDLVLRRENRCEQRVHTVWVRSEELPDATAKSPRVTSGLNLPALEASCNQRRLGLWQVNRRSFLDFRVLRPFNAQPAWATTEEISRPMVGWSIWLTYSEITFCDITPSARMSARLLCGTSEKAKRPSAISRGVCLRVVDWKSTVVSDLLALLFVNVFADHLVGDRS